MGYGFLRDCMWSFGIRSWGVEEGQRNSDRQISSLELFEPVCELVLQGNNR